jgi:spectinomycin phosphotransferase
MLEQPDIPNERIVAHLHGAFDLRVTRLSFLPVGADMNSAAYRVVTGDGGVHFTKLRLRGFDDISAILPKHLGDAGIVQVMAPRTTREGQPFAHFGDGAMVVYPYVDGVTGHDVVLTENQWRSFGAAIRALHSMDPMIFGGISRETFAGSFRDPLSDLLLRLDDVPNEDALIADVIALLRAKRDAIRALIERAESLARKLRERPPAFVVCHSDLHAHNLLVGRDGALCVVDWDSPTVAPKERDLMFVGGTRSFLGYTPEQEERLFLRGYGETQVNRTALAYYRCERVIKDFVDAYVEISSPLGTRDRERSLRYLASIFEVDGVFDVARRT